MTKIYLLAFLSMGVKQKIIKALEFNLKSNENSKIISKINQNYTLSNNYR